MSVTLWYRSTLGVYNDYLWLYLTSLEPGRYRVTGSWSAEATSSISDTVRHQISFCDSNSTVEFHYEAYWKIVPPYLSYCWFADIYVKKAYTAEFSYVIHPLPGISTGDQRLSRVEIGSGYNRCVVGSTKSVFVQKVETDAYKSFLREVSLASLL